MLHSWFGQKSSSGETDTHRRSTEPLSTRNRPSASTTTDVPPQPSNSPKTAFDGITTPHDTVLSRLTGAVQVSSQQGGAPEQETINGPNILQPHVSPSIPAKSTGSIQSSPRPPSLQDPLQDPFDGSTIGMLAPQDSSMDARNNDQKAEEMWTHLSRVLELQGEIAMMHMNMEGIRLGKAGDAKSKGKGSSSPSGSTTTPSHPPMKPPRFESTLSQLDPAIRRAHERDGGEGVDVPDEEAEQNRIREEQFARLADQFEGRKEAINDIMDKLENLSEALTEFNALPIPNIEFPSSRHSTKPPERLSPAMSNLSSTGILPQSLSRSKPSQPSKVRHPPVPSVIVRPTEGSMPHLFDSPVSTIGSLKLPPEE
ncbi:hypothetical protein BDQ17DRAFT_1341411 [Cyathus striatus]|nr:hypothetical protein BDQ17DRAFT_1341411 [Cyathus striatus]